jgi:hypothetical protein
MSWKVHKADFPKLAEKLSVIRTDRHEDLVRPKNILPVRKKSPKKFTVMCIMFSLAFLECFTPVLAIGHLISPLVFIEVKVIQFLVFSVVQNCICYVFYSVCLEFCCFDDLALCQSEWLITSQQVSGSLLYVLFRTFHDNFQVKLFPPKKYSLNIC